MPKTSAAAPWGALIDETGKAIQRQRTLISDRSARGKPVGALNPVLDQLEKNLRILHKVKRFLDEADRKPA